MGRPFEFELEKCEKTIQFANSVALEELPDTLSNHIGAPIILIGAGGSLTCAEFGRRLFEQKGCFCRTATPLEFISSTADYRGSSVLILSANGNNQDIMGALEIAIERETKNITAICTAKGSKMARIASRNPRVRAFEFPLTSGKDGYLASNSLLATCAILARSMTGETLNPEIVSDCVQTGRMGFDELVAQRKFKHCTILFEGWTSPAALDLESKLSEAGLLSSMLCDFRQFAHGRHNWMDKQSDQSAVVAFSTPVGHTLARATLSELPEEIPKWHHLASRNDACGGLESVLAVFGFVANVGKRAGIDPGRPNVPSYGSKLYRIGPRGFRKKAKSATKGSANLEAATERKLAALGLADATGPVVEEHAVAYVRKLRSQPYGALVVDFDGTTSPLNDRNGRIPAELAAKMTELLEAGVSVYFATGRGDSIHDSLKTAFPKPTWKRIRIGYYNGSFCLSLANYSKFEASLSSDKALFEFEDILRSHPTLTKQCSISNKQSQITLKVLEDSSTESVTNILRDLVQRQRQLAIKFVISSHSIDILPESSTKLTCVKEAQKALKDTREVLTVGDCGAFPGNDFELLQHGHSLSVHKVSTDLESCWNVLPPGISHTEGTFFYLKNVEIRRGTFRLRL